MAKTIYILDAHLEFTTETARDKVQQKMKNQLNAAKTEDAWVAGKIAVSQVTQAEVTDVTTEVI